MIHGFALREHAVFTLPAPFQHHCFTLVIRAAAKSAYWLWHGWYQMQVAGGGGNGKQLASGCRRSPKAASLPNPIDYRDGHKA
jgi:hypothetical protein